MRRLLLLICSLTPFVSEEWCEAQEEADEKPLKVMIVAGGVNHDYSAQVSALTKGFDARSVRNVEWTTKIVGNGRGDEKVSLFDKASWADGYDLIVHLHCFPPVGDLTYLNRVLVPHQLGKPAVLIHGALLSFQGVEGNEWFDFCGVEASRRAEMGRLDIAWKSPDDTITKGIEEWTTNREEYYLIQKTGPGVEIVAEAKSQEGTDPQPVGWHHRYGGKQSRVFATSLGNETGIMESSEYLDFVSRGMLWALGLDLEAGWRRSESLESEGTSDQKEESSQYSVIHPGEGRILGSSATSKTLPSFPDDSVDSLVDGNSDTVWTSPGKGGVTVVVDLEEVSEVARWAIFWGRGGKFDFTAEVSEDLDRWRPVESDWIQSDSGQVSVSPPGTMKSRALRLNFPVPGANGGPVIQDIAAYQSVDDLPGPLQLALPALVGGEESDEEKEDGEPALKSLEIRGQTAKQLVGTAEGKAWLLAESDEDGGVGIIYGLDDSKAELGYTEFYYGVTPGAAIAWDGEWVYVAEIEVRGENENAYQVIVLRAYRDTSRDGVADERLEFREVNVRDLKPGAGLSEALELGGMTIGAGGEFLVVLGERGQPWSRMIQFNRTSGDGELVLHAEKAIRSMRIDDDGLLVFSIGQEGGDRQTFRGERLRGSAARSLEPEMDRQVPGTAAPLPSSASLMAKSGSKKTWFVAESKDHVIRISLLDDSAEARPSLVWDRLSDEEVVQHFQDEDSLVRWEAPFELARRKRGFRGKLMNRYSRALGSEYKEMGWLRMVAFDAARSGIDPFLLATRSEFPRVRAQAFRFLGDQPNSANHRAFSAIQKETVPLVTGAILGAISASGSQLEGLLELVLSWAGSDEPALSEVARSFLLSSGGEELCLQILGDPIRSESWPLAFDVLSYSAMPDVVTSLSGKLMETSSPEFREAGIIELAAMYRRLEGEEADEVVAFLNSMLGNHRVNQSLLLEAMQTNGLPFTDRDRLLRLGEASIPHESAIIEILSSGPTPDGATDWLELIADDEHRDLDLRQRAVSLLADIEDESVYDLVFRLAREWEIETMLPSTRQQFFEKWLGNPLLADNLDRWERESQSSDVTARYLAWRALLNLASDASGWARLERQSRQLDDQQVDLLRRWLSLGEWSEARAQVVAMSESGGGAVEEAAALLLVQPDGKVANANQRDTDAEGAREALSGEQLFSKADCRTCHNLTGEGYAIGPDLIEAALTKSADELSEAIRHPAMADDLRTGFVSMQLAGDRQMKGRIISEENGVISVMDSGGNLLDLEASEVISKGELEDDSASGPIGASLSTEEVAALVEYLQAVSANF